MKPADVINAYLDAPAPRLVAGTAQAQEFGRAQHWNVSEDQRVEDSLRDRLQDDLPGDFCDFCGYECGL